MEAGKKVAVIRHPMPYGKLEEQVQRFATYEDLDLHKCTIEEREEYEPHIDHGMVVYAGIDYKPSCVRQSRKPMSYSGMEATTTCLSITPTCT